jgi:hypothetical protein
MANLTEEVKTELRDILLNMIESEDEELLELLGESDCG